MKNVFIRQQLLQEWCGTAINVCVCPPQCHRAFAVIIMMLHSSSLLLSVHIWLSELHFGFPLLVSASLTCSRTTSTQPVWRMPSLIIHSAQINVINYTPVFHYTLICECITLAVDFIFQYLQAVVALFMYFVMSKHMLVSKWVAGEPNAAFD